MPNPDERTAAAPTLGLRIEAALASKLNLADFQNAVPLIRELKVINGTAGKASNLELTIRSEPEFLHAKTWHLDAVSAEQQVRIADLDVVLEGPLFLRLTEAEKATVRFTLCPAGPPSEPLAELVLEVDLLPRNQWGGLNHLPEMLAAFVQPNDPCVDRVLKQAAEILTRNGKPSGLDGYTGGAKRAWELVSAIWSALAAQGLDYALPPASFEFQGQKVRGPAQILESGLATCLDLTLFICAVCEQAGLNPLVVMTKGHAFAGVWLRAEEFSTVVVDDVTALRKRVALKEMVLLETTLLTQKPAPPFQFAVEVGAQQIAEAQDAQFGLVVDIRRARLHRIKPLASAEASAQYERSAAPVVQEPAFGEAPDLPEEADLPEPSPADLDPKDRLARWQRKLLDLSLRNNLLNFKESKKTLRLEVPDAEALEDLLAQGETLKLLPMPDLMEGSDLRNQAIYQGREREDVRRGHAVDALQRREVFVNLNQPEMEARLVEQFRAARTTMQEGGANTLFLAIGFLSWNQSNKPDQRLRAPMILLPVTLNRRSVRSGFTLTLHEDEPRFNPTLLEMLRQDFSLNLGIADGELPRGETGIDVAGIWRNVARAVKDIKGWEVSEDVVLAMFSFAKHLMWKDLTDRTDQLRENPVVRHLIDTPRENYASGIAFPNPQRLDKEFGPEQSFCPMEADSSQLSAVLAAAQGKDFVLIGPPGTGKSQTIANVIAQCLGEGKRVLFVSEKIAALEVVHRRLKEVGLGDFCLEIHSNKARKQEVLNKLQQAWQAQGDVDPETWRVEADRLKWMRSNLNVYVERLHWQHPNGWTLYRAMAQVMNGAELPRLGLGWASPHDHGRSDLDVMRDAVARLEVNALAIGSMAQGDHPLATLGCADWSPIWQQKLIQAALDLSQVVQGVDEAFERFVQGLALPKVPLDRHGRAGMEILARILPEASGRNWRFVLRLGATVIASRLAEGAGLVARHQELSAQLSAGWPEPIVHDCERGLGLLEERRALKERLEAPYPPAITDGLKKGLGFLDRSAHETSTLSVRYADRVESLDIFLLQREWALAEASSWPLSWIRKRRIRQALLAVAEGGGEIDVGHDVQVLARIRSLHSKVAALDLSGATDGLWAGRATDVRSAAVALAFQDVLNAAHQDQPWEDEGFEPVAEGRCGERLRRQLVMLRALASLDRDLEALGYLKHPTAGLWDGLATRSNLLRTALCFLQEAGTIRVSGALTANYPEVARGDCSAALATDIRNLQERARIEDELRGYQDLAEATDGLWVALKTDQEEVRRLIPFLKGLNEAIGSLARTPEEGQVLKMALDHILGEGNPLLMASCPAMEAAKAYLAASAPLGQAIQDLCDLGCLAPAPRLLLEDLATTDLTRYCQILAGQETRLHAWCAWQKAIRHCQSLGLGPVVQAIEKGLLGKGTIRPGFETDYCRWWLNAVVDGEEVVRTFVSAEHEKRIEDFRSLDTRFTKLTRDWVRAKLCSGIQDPEQVSKHSEWGHLRYEMAKKKRHLPLRELLAQCPRAVASLTPCLLMSPLSIAQYLGVEAPAFDLVVFDEASQIPVWDAIGAIARGRQVVMVGDPKQLPPTNFFSRADSDGDDQEVEGDLESILDECMGANLPTLNLDWHYRSRHESLIAFSNHHYYGGGLVTFPSPVTRDNAVSFQWVKGVYERGGARINKPEAKALVDEVVRRLRSQEFKDAKLTLGIITFNAEQQSLIENLLDDARRSYPSIEPYFSDSETEPVFVKNLESVQGDERDIIYFSITYGPDLAGVSTVNFGPLNKDGGERRLNVAITRARQELRVFSSLKADQINLARTQATGVRDLKYFLDFADRGAVALAEEVRPSQGSFESPFEEAIAAALVRKGWAVSTQVGVSAYRIDLAVIHPDVPGSFLAGIECDGATYHRSATARDRDKLREQVLRRLGWEILRVWSTDWWIDPVGTLEKLHQSLQDVLEINRAKRSAESEATAAVGEPPSDSDHPGDATAMDSPFQPAASAWQPSAPPVSGEERTEPAEDAEYAQDNGDGVGNVEPDTFLSPEYDPVLARMIDQVVETEGPILDSVLGRRIARMHGWQRTGVRIQTRVESLAARSLLFTREDHGRFFWPKSLAPESPVPPRKAWGALERSVEEVCLPELVSLAREVIGLGGRDASSVTLMARALGLNRVKSANRERLEKALTIAEHHDA